MNRRSYISGMVSGILLAVGILFGFLLARFDSDIFAQQATPTVPASNTPEILPTETFPPSSPLPSVTPQATLRPPPTFEPPTATLPPSLTPSPTPTTSLRLDVTAPVGLQGISTATLEGAESEVCEKREDWTLRYTIQSGDALANIAALYGTFVNELVEGNCLEDANKIIAGQVLRVPGDVQPAVPQYECTTWEALTPFNGAFTIPGDGNVTFNWRGPLAERYLVRVVMPSGTIWEELVEMRQNLAVDIHEVLPESGVHTWYVYPLGMDFLQIPCPEGGPWTFNKDVSPTLTWTPTSTPTATNTPQTWQQTATAKAARP